MFDQQDERQKYLDAAKKAGAKIDKKADEIVGQGETILGNVKKSKWTAAALAGVTAVGVIAAYLIIK